MSIGIYKITSPSGKVYIGQSKNIEQRFNQYSRPSQNSQQKKLTHSLKKYGFEKHAFEILEYCDISQLNHIERHFQEVYDVCGEFGLNLKLTCTTQKRAVYSKETRLKMSAIAKDRTFSLQTRTKLSSSGSGQNNIFSKLILNTETGIYYYGLSEASSASGINKGTIWLRITKKNKTYTPFIYA